MMEVKLIHSFWLVGLLLVHCPGMMVVPLHEHQILKTVPCSTHNVHFQITASAVAIQERLDGGIFVHFIGMEKVR